MFNTYENTEYDWREITDSVLTQRLEFIKNEIKLDKSTVCYTICFGGLEKSCFKRISKLHGVDIISCKSVVKFPLSILVSFIPSHGGLVKIESSDAIYPVVDTLTDQACALIFVFSKEFSEEFENNVKNDLSAEHYGVEKLESYFILGLDTDAPVETCCRELGSWKNYSQLIS